MAGDSLSTVPSGFTESRISTDPSWTATSTQLPPADFVLLRHSMDGTPRSVTATPFPPRGWTSAGTDRRRARAECPLSCGIVGEDAADEPIWLVAAATSVIRVQCRPNRAIRLVRDQLVAHDLGRQV